MIVWLGLLFGPSNKYIFYVKCVSPQGLKTFERIVIRECSVIQYF